MGTYMKNTYTFSKIFTPLDEAIALNFILNLAKFYLSKAGRRLKQIYSRERSLSQILSSYAKTVKNKRTVLNFKQRLSTVLLKND